MLPHHLLLLLPLLLPCTCEQVTVDGAGLVTMPGTLARHYASLGGEVALMGKPASIIYETATQLGGSGSTRLRWLAVGDSLEHDVLGYDR